MRFEKDWGRLGLKYKEVNLGELISFVSKGIPPKYIETKSDNTIVVLNQRTNRNFQIDYSLSRLNDLSKKKVPTNKILIDYDVLINSTGVGTAGRVAQLVKVPELTTVDGHMIIVRPDEEKIDPLYLGYALKAQQVKIEGLQEGSTGQTELNRQRLLNDIIIQFPESRKLQQDISRLFFSLDEKIENNKKINHHLEEMATSIFENMFPNVSSGKSTIGNYIIPKRGKNLLSKDAIVGKVPVVAGGLQPSTFHNIANTKSPVLTISASGANAGYVNLWHIPVWSSDSSYIDTSITDNVYFWYVMLKKRQQEIYDSQTGSAQPHIYPKHIEIMPTIDLSEDKVSRFTKQVTPLFESIGNNIKEIGELQTLRDTLLPKLLSGEIPVNQATK